MKVSMELEDLVRLAGVQHEAPAIPSDDGAPVGGGCGMHPNQDMRNAITLLSPQEAPVEEAATEESPAEETATEEAPTEEESSKDK